MRKILVSLAAALVLLIGLHVQPASAHQVPPLQWTWDSVPGTACEVIDRYGTYGSGFAEFVYANNATNCHPYSWIQVSTSYGGYIYETWCNINGAIYAPNSGCYAFRHSTGRLGIRVVGPGIAFALKLTLIGPNGSPTLVVVHGI